MDIALDTLASQPWALGIFAAVLALILGVRHLGLWQGQKNGPSATTTQAQVAAVIVDPSALDRLSGEISGLAIAQTEANKIAREQLKFAQDGAQEAINVSRQAVREVAQLHVEVRELGDKMRR